MTCKINASTTGAGGLLLESDSSGALDLQSNGVTKVSFDASGNMTTQGTIPASALTGNVASSLLSGNLPVLDGSALTNIAAANLTGTLPAIDGSNLTGIATGLTASAYSQSSNGYITLSNGLIIQWTRQGALANGGIRTILFPITFPNQCFSFAASWTVMTSGTHHSAFPDPQITASSFGAYNVSGATQGVVFVATGR